MNVVVKRYEDLFDEMDRELRRLSDETLMHFFRPPDGEEVWAPRADVYETNDELVVKISAAGLKPKDIEVFLSADNMHLTVCGFRREPASERKGRVRYYQMEIYFGPFQRIVPLPAHIDIDRDRLHAAYSQGFLKVVLPKVIEDDTGIRRVVPIDEE